MMNWLRLYWSVLNYHKILNVAAEADEEIPLVLGIWVSLLCVAGRGDPGPDGGRLLLTKGRPATMSSLARELAVDQHRLARLMELFAEYGSLAFDDGTWFIKNWGEYQMRSDLSTSRVRKHRAKKKERAAGEAKAQDELPLAPANDDAQALINHFTKSTGFYPPAPGATEAWRDQWLGPAIELLHLAGGDVDRAKAEMSGTLALMNELGLRYTSVRSLVKTTQRHLGERAWRLVLEEIRQVGQMGHHDLPPELDEAIRRAGGWNYLCTGRPDETEQRFVQAYVQGLRK